MTYTSCDQSDLNCRLYNDYDTHVFKIPIALLNVQHFALKFCCKLHPCNSLTHVLSFASVYAVLLSVSISLFSSSITVNRVLAYRLFLALNRYSHTVTLIVLHTFDILYCTSRKVTFEIIAKDPDAKVLVKEYLLIVCSVIQ